MEVRSARLPDLFLGIKNELTDYYSKEELQPLIHIILEYITGLNRTQMVLNKDKELSESQIYFIQTAVERLKKYEPIQYITGIAHFHDYKFKVNKSVLIPRPETEELVQWICSEQGDKNVSILDIGTGSGCIAVTLKKKLPSAGLTAIDISEEALAIAMENATLLGADVKFEKIDILNANEREALPVYDVIVSNPPYVTPSDRKKMKPNVTEHEPGQALYVEDNPLLYYQEILAFSKDHLNDGGSVYFETNENYAAEVSQIMETAGFSNIIIRKDMQGKDRMVMGAKPRS